MSQRSFALAEANLGAREVCLTIGNNPSFIVGKCRHHVPTVLITGASRGLGLEFARQYGLEGWKVIATCRNPDAALDLSGMTGDISILPMDIEEPDQVAATATALMGVTVDLLLNNVGVVGPRNATASFGDIDIAAWLDVMRVNAMLPLKVTEAFIDHIKASERKMVVFISSRSGSIAERGFLAHHLRGGSYIYRSSKAALNAVAKGLSFDLAPLGIGVLVLHPGWVKSGAGDLEAPLDVETSVSCMLKVIGEFSATETGTFRNYDGEVIPW